MKEKLTFSFILIIIIAGISGCTTPLGDFEYTGDKDPITVSKSTHTVVMLDFHVAVGSITLYNEPNANYLVYIENEVSIREGSGGTLEAAEEVTYSEVDSETMKVQFDSQDEGIRVDYSYEINITVGTNITLVIDLTAITGKVFTIITDKGIHISSLDLESSTGAVQLELKHVQFSDASPTIKTETDWIIVNLEDINCTGSTAWSISGSTGNINVDVKSYYGNDPLSHIFSISASTGSISVETRLTPEIGLKITTSVSTGSITIPGGGETYSSANFDSASTKYYFDLSTSTGDIKFTESIH
ncbi:MAG: hypothetical protein ACFFC6_14615 [Promethearchaeota archaeon]